MADTSLINVDHLALVSQSDLLYQSPVKKSLERHPIGHGYHRRQCETPSVGHVNPPFDKTHTPVPLARFTITCPPYTRTTISLTRCYGSFNGIRTSLALKAPIQKSVLDGLGQVVHLDRLGRFQVGDRAGQATDLVVGSSAETKFGHGLAQ